MNKIVYVILREYLTRVREKSFIFTTICVPLVMTLLILLPMYLAKKNDEVNIRKVALIGNIEFVKAPFENNNYEIVNYDNFDWNNIESLVAKGKLMGALRVKILPNGNLPIYQYYYKKKPEQSLLQEVESAIQKRHIDRYLEMNCSSDILEYIKTIRDNKKLLETIQINTEQSVNKSSSAKSSICIFLTLIIYMLIFLFSAEVMKGVQDEKKNRIVEVIITSASTFKFISGKVIGISLLGLTQIAVWIAISISLSTFVVSKSSFTNSEIDIVHRIKPEQINLVMENINSIDWDVTTFVFVLFFILGYFLYSSIFAVLGTITKAEQSQQLATLASSPLILSIIMISEVIRDSDGLIVKIFSMIPFTSPIIMVGRSIYGVSAAEICLSLGILFVSTILIIYIAGKIYHNTIFYTGKGLKITDILQSFKIKN